MSDIVVYAAACAMMWFWSVMAAAAESKGDEAAPEIFRDALTARGALNSDDSPTVPAAIKLLALPDPTFMRLYRLSQSQFEKLYEVVSPKLPHARKRDRGGRPIVHAESHYLLMFLEYLAHGSSLRRLGAHYSMHGTDVTVSSVHRLLRATAQAVSKSLAPYMTFPSREEQGQIAGRVWDRYHFPSACGFIDGCHIFVSPANPAEKSSCRNYKGFNSVVLLAVVDDRLRFRFFTLGGAGAFNDRRSFRRSDLTRRQEGEPEGRLVKPPYVILGDSGFDPRPWLVVPYDVRGPPQRQFNQRLSSARMCVERAFGVLKASARLLGMGNNNGMVATCIYARAALLLHNFRIAEGGDHNVYTEEDLAPDGMQFERDAAAAEEQEGAAVVRHELHVEMATALGLPLPAAPTA